jgi:LmbE family N-acetylglucosaminyl deacetylase
MVPGRRAPRVGSLEMTSELIDRIEDSRRILVVAPHPDDESLGCGGLVAKLARRGRAFQFVFVTDGSASHRGSRSWPRQRLAARRKAEAQEALNRLGVGYSPRVFLGLADSAIPAAFSTEWQSVLVRLEAISREFQPDLALLPWRRDPHRDHQDSWVLAHTALRRAGSTCLILEYAIWLDELGGFENQPRANEADLIMIDVASTIDAKRAAIAAHQTQTTDLIDDDPGGFRLTCATIARLTRPTEAFWWPLHESD